MHKLIKSVQDDISMRNQAGGETFKLSQMTRTALGGGSLHLREGSAKATAFTLPTTFAGRFTICPCTCISTALEHKKVFLTSNSYVLCETCHFDKNYAECCQTVCFRCVILVLQRCADDFASNAFDYQMMTTMHFIFLVPKSGKE